MAREKTSGARAGALDLGPQWLRVVLAVSIVMNAILYQQLAKMSQHAVVVQGTMKEGADRGPDEVERLGQSFATTKMAELLSQGIVELTPKALRNISKYPDESLAVPGAAMLSVHLSAEETGKRILRPETADLISRRLRDLGVVILPSVIDDASCRTLLEYTNERIQNPIYDFNSVREFMYRKDLALEIKGPVRDALQRVFPLIKNAMDEFLGEGAPLREVGTMNSYPGTKAQIFHADSNLDEGQAAFITSFLYLDDIRDDQAPLDVYPGTHRLPYRNLPLQTKFAIEERTPFLRAIVPRGSLVMYNSLLRHRGSANTSPLLRPTLYFSFYEVGEQEPDGSFTFLDVYKGLDIAKVLADEIPMAPITIEQRHHKDKACLEGMQTKCPDREGLELFKCAVNFPGKIFASDEEDDWWPTHSSQFHIPESCALVSRMEKLAQAGIFAPNYVTMTSEGALK